MTNAKLILSFVVVARRGFATATRESVSGNMKGSGIEMMKKVSEESKKSSPWVPDPVTGYYKPEGQTNQVDAADQLRELLFKQKNRRI